ncbi:hypothetical protein [Lactococcus cremoris]|uniref:hypothetical protein n=1 Tax=Lactococcus lactis subsp. cremoris TaxID=1359 RepID=UPI0021824E87|nr:hypothetical protein [Lactococcus cremoris]MCT0500551.1 hypothetical protein [Lactococcus cremoris]
MYSLKSIEILDDPYGLEQVNCLEQPVGIALNSYNKDYYNLFLIFHKLIQCYKVDFYYQKNIHKCPTMDRISVVLMREFGIDLKCKNLDHDFLDFINLNLSKNNPVFVPANLKELYYSLHYKTSDWIHLFLLYEYNSNTNLYSTLDSLQVYQKFSNYYKFVIPTNILEKIYRSSRENLSSKGVYYFDSNQISKNIDVVHFVKKCLYLFCFKRMDMPFIEKDLLKEGIEKNTLSKSDIRKFFNILHYKEVFFKELNRFFVNIEVSPELREEFKKSYQDLIKEAKMVVPKITYQLYKKNYSNANDKFEVIIKKELRVTNVLLKIYEKISESEVELGHDNTHYVVYNNKDNIVNNLSKENFNFDFNTKNIYNNWFSDEAPSIILCDKSSQMDIKGIRIGADFEVLKSKKDSFFMAGIYFKTGKGSRYLFGIQSNNSICFEKTAIDPELIKFPNDTKTVHLDLESNGNRLDLIKDGNIFFSSKNFLLDNDIVEMGITCKTWGIAEPIKIAVKNISIMELNN